MSPQRLIAAAILSLALISCAGTSDADVSEAAFDKSPVVAVGETQPVAVPTEGAPALDVDPCALLPLRRAEQLLQGPVETKAKTSDTGVVCSFTSGQSAVTLQVMPNDGSTDLGDDSGRWNSDAYVYGEPVEVEGIGKRAVRFGGRMMLVALADYEFRLLYAPSRLPADQDPLADLTPEDLAGDARTIAAGLK